MRNQSGPFNHNGLLTSSAAPTPLDGMSAGFSFRTMLPVPRWNGGANAIPTILYKLLPFLVASSRVPPFSRCSIPGREVSALF